MSMTIIPQGSENTMLINYANVISVFTMENVPMTNQETGEEIQGFVIGAEVVENEEVQTLGVYETGIEMEQAMSKLIHWLGNSEVSEYGNVFRMPD